MFFEPVEYCANLQQDGLFRS